MILSSTFARRLGLVLAVGLAGAECGAAPAQPGKPESGKATKPAEAAPATSDIQKFCTANAVIIGDARIAWQTAKLREIEARVRRGLLELEAKKAEYIAWLKSREDALRQATDSVVAIYTRMRPDSAALQLAAMEDAMAAAVLAKLPSRAAGVILNEMEAGRAARLARAMAGPDGTTDGKKS